MRSGHFGNVFGGKVPSRGISEPNHLLLKDWIPRDVGLLKLCEECAPAMPAEAFLNSLGPYSHALRIVLPFKCYLRQAFGSQLVRGSASNPARAHGPGSRRREPREPLRSESPVTVGHTTPNGRLKNGEAPNDRLERRNEVRFISPASGSDGPTWVRPPDGCRFLSKRNRRELAEEERGPGFLARAPTASPWRDGEGDPGGSGVRELPARGPRQVWARGVPILRGVPC